VHSEPRDERDQAGGTDSNKREDERSAIGEARARERDCCACSTSSMMPGAKDGTLANPATRSGPASLLRSLPYAIDLIAGALGNRTRLAAASSTNSPRFEALPNGAIQREGNPRLGAQETSPSWKVLCDGSPYRRSPRTRMRYRQKLGQRPKRARAERVGAHLDSSAEEHDGHEWRSSAQSGRHGYPAVTTA